MLLREHLSAVFHSTSLLYKGAQEIFEPNLSQVSESLYLKLKLEEKAVKHTKF